MTITSLVPTVEQQFTMPEIVAEEAIFIRNTTGGATIATSNLRIKGHADDVAKHWIDSLAQITLKLIIKKLKTEVFQGWMVRWFLQVASYLQIIRVGTHYSEYQMKA